MAQMIPNAAMVTGTVIGKEPYSQQEGFVVLSLIVKTAGHKTGMRFLGNDLFNKEIKILVNNDIIGKLKIGLHNTITSEIKKVSPVLWRAIEETLRLKEPAVVRSVKPPKKK